MANLKLWPHSLTHWPTDSPNYKEMLSHLKRRCSIFLAGLLIFPPKSIYKTFVLDRVMTKIQGKMSSSDSKEYLLNVQYIAFFIAFLRISSTSHVPLSRSDEMCSKDIWRCVAQVNTKDPPVLQLDKKKRHVQIWSILRRWENVVR